MKWFREVTGIDELRKCYKTLLLKHHPDNGGDVSAMQEISAEYDLLFDRLREENKEGGKTCAYDENDENRAFKEMLNVIISYRMEIEIIGLWIWCFDCFACKDKLKELGFCYAPKKKAWCWHFGEYRRHHKKEVSLDEIRQKYGSKKISGQAEQTKIG